MANENNQITIPNVEEPIKPLTMITIHNSIKLTSTNYLSWKPQMEAILINYDLYKFSDGSYLAPTATTTTNNGVKPNPEYQIKINFFTALVGTLSPLLIPLIT